MNFPLLLQYIDQYKAEFSRISKMELYKWQAVQRFQEVWDLDREDFPEMLKESLDQTRNLLASGSYFPRNAVEALANENPSLIRDTFIDLFDESVDLVSRINLFRNTMDKFQSEKYPGRNAYQDQRAVMVYLTLRYPERYYFYKFTMMKDFCQQLNYDYLPKAGRDANVPQFLKMCDQVNHVVMSDNQLLKMHNERIQDTEYFFDVQGHILTQDLIYAVTKHLHIVTGGDEKPSSSLRFKEIPFRPQKTKIKLRGSIVNHQAAQEKNKRIGDLGERIVLRYEQDHCPKKFRDAVKHAAVEEGDGLGFDILSWDQDGKEKFIEVKATTGDWNQTFFITANELEKSREAGEQYFLYRLYNINQEQQSADCFVHQGDLSALCVNPVDYKVNLSAPPGDHLQIK